MPYIFLPFRKKQGCKWKNGMVKYIHQKREKAIFFVQKDEGKIRLSRKGR